MYFWVYLNLGTTEGCRNSECQLVTPTRIKQSFFRCFELVRFLLSTVQPPSRRLLFLGGYTTQYIGDYHHPNHPWDGCSHRYQPVWHNTWRLASRDSRVTQQKKEILSSIPSENSMNQPVFVEGAVKNQYGQSSDCSWCDWWLSNSMNPIIIPLSFSHWIGLRNKYRKTPIFNAKIYGVRFRFSQKKAIHWISGLIWF